MPTLRLEIINELGEVGLTSLIDVGTKAEAWERVKGAHRFYWPQGFFTRYSMPDEFEPRDYSKLNQALAELSAEGAAMMASGRADRKGRTMPKKGIERECPGCGRYGRICTLEPVAGKPGQTYKAASCPSCGRTDRTRSRIASPVRCKEEGCRERLMLAEVTSYKGYCMSHAYARDSAH